MPTMWLSDSQSTYKYGEARSRCRDAFAPRACGIAGKLQNARHCLLTKLLRTEIGVAFCTGGLSAFAMGGLDATGPRGLGGLTG